MWVIFSLLSGLFYTGQGLLTRYVLRSKRDAWAFSFYFSFIGALVSLPFMLADPTLPQMIFPWIVILAVGFLIVGNNWLNFKSSNYIGASINGAVLKFRLVWVLVLSVLILGESFSLEKSLATLIAISSGLIIIKGLKKPKSIKGVVLAFSSTFVYATVIMIYKLLFNNFNSPTLTFFIFFFPAVINFIVMPQAKTRIGRLYKEDGGAVVTACVLGGLANLAMNQALLMGEASRALVIIESFLILTLIGELVLLKEREGLIIKMLAVAGAVASAVLIRIG